MPRHTKRLEEGGGMQHFRDALAFAISQVVEFPPGVLVTVVEAKVTSDTRFAKGVLSVFPISAEKEVLKILSQSTQDIKEELSERLRLRRIPRIHWSFDETEERAAAIEKALNELGRQD